MKDSDYVNMLTSVYEFGSNLVWYLHYAYENEEGYDLTLVETLL